MHTAGLQLKPIQQQVVKYDAKKVLNLLRILYDIVVLIAQKFSRSILDFPAMDINISVCILQELFDYEVDSDDEWEEEEPGESLSNSEVNNGSTISWQNL